MNYEANHLHSNCMYLKCSGQCLEIKDSVEIVVTAVTTIRSTRA